MDKSFAKNGLTIYNNHFISNSKCSLQTGVYWSTSLYFVHLMSLYNKWRKGGCITVRIQNITYSIHAYTVDDSHTSLRLDFIFLRLWKSIWPITLLWTTKEKYWNFEYSSRSGPESSLAIAACYNFSNAVYPFNDIPWGFLPVNIHYSKGNHLISRKDKGNSYCFIQAV